MVTNPEKNTLIIKKSKNNIIFFKVFEEVMNFSLWFFVFRNLGGVCCISNEYYQIDQIQELTFSLDNKLNEFAKRELENHFFFQRIPQ